MAHLVWDWNGTLLDDLPLIVTATNTAIAAVGGPAVTADEHRRDFRRPIVDYYAYVLGRPVGADEFVLIDRAFHDAYRLGMAACPLTRDAVEAMTGWLGSQSLLSMWFHHELVPEVARRGLAGLLTRVDGLRSEVGGGRKAGYLAEHLTALALAGEECVVIGDSIDDADAAESVGARCVLYDGGYSDRDRLAATGHPVASTLTEAVRLAAGPLAPSATPPTATEPTAVEPTAAEPTAMQNMIRPRYAT